MLRMLCAILRRHPVLTQILVILVRRQSIRSAVGRSCSACFQAWQAACAGQSLRCNAMRHPARQDLTLIQSVAGR
jgi:hypothetical protein